MDNVEAGVKNLLGNMEQEMKKVIDKMNAEYGALRTGRANPQLLESIKVEYYGSLVPLKQVAALSVPEARTIEVRPWDPSSLEAIEKSLQKSDLGIPPSSDGKVIRLNFPAMNEQRRKDLVKVVGKVAETYRVALRNVRRDSVEKLKRAEKAKELAEDDRRRDEEHIQKLTDLYNKKIDDTLASKEKEILEV